MALEYVVSSDEGASYARMPRYCHCRGYGKSAAAPASEFPDSNTLHFPRTGAEGSVEELYLREIARSLFPVQHIHVINVLYSLSTLLYSTLLYSTLLYSTLLYSTLLYSTLLYSTLLYSTLLYSTLLYSTT